MLELTFTLLVRTAWCAAILLVLVWIVQKAGARWLSPRARYALWLLVAARLVILWSPPSSLSLVGQLEQRIESAFAPQEMQTPQVALADDSPEIASAMDIAPIANPAFISAEFSAAEAPIPITTWNWSDVPIWSILAAIWAFGALAFSLRLARDFWRLRCEVKTMAPVIAPEVLELVRRIQSQLALKQRIQILVSDQIASPAVTGVFRPALLMPAQFVSQLTENELEHVIRHELTHVKRRDVLVNWLLAAIGAVYWFFPLMRYLLAQLRKTRELACDAAVLQTASANERKAYGKTLLKIMEMVSEADRPMLTFTVGVAGMVWPMGSFRKESKMMRERLELVVMDRSKRSRAGWLVAAMAVMLIAVGFTEAQELKKPKIDITEEEVLFLTGDGQDVKDAQAVPKAAGAYTAGYRDFEAPAGDLISKDFDLTDTIASLKHPKSPDEKHAKQELEAWLNRVIKESLWNGGAESHIFWKDNVATIRQTKEGHERLQRALSALRASNEQFAIEFSIGTLAAEDFQKLNLREYKNVKASVMAPRRAKLSSAVGAVQSVSRRIPSSIFALSPEQTAKLQKELYGFKSHERLTAPTVITTSSVPAQIVSGTTRPFVTSVDRIAEGVEQPTVDVFYDGIETDLQVIALGENKAWVRLCCRKSEVTGVSKETPPGAATEIQSPTIVETTQTLAQEINLGETLAIFGVAGGKEKGKEEVMVVFANVKTLESAPAVEKPKNAAAAPEEDKLTTVTFPIADVLIFKPSETDNEGTAASIRRYATAELKLFVAMFKESNPEFEKAPGRKIECDFDKLTVTLTGTAQDVSSLKQQYYFRKKRMEDAAIKTLAPAKPIAKSPNEDSTEFVPPMFGKARPVNREKSNVVDPNNATQTKQSIDKALQLTIETKFKDKPLSEALNLIGKGANINIVVDPAGYVEEGIQSRQPVSLDLQNKPATIQNALRLILDPLGLDFIVKEHSLLITSKRLMRRSSTTVTYDVADFFLLCTPKSKGGKQSDEVDCGNPFTHIFAYLGRKLPKFVPGEDTNEMQPFWTNRTLVVSASTELQEKVAEFIKNLNKMSVEEAKQLIETNNVIADPSGQLLGRVDKSGNILRAYKIDNELLRKLAGSSEKDHEPKQEARIALQTLKSFIEGVIPAFTEKKSGVWIHDFTSNQSLSVNAPQEDQEKVADLIMQLNRVSVADLEKAVEDSKRR